MDENNREILIDRLFVDHLDKRLIIQFEDCDMLQFLEEHLKMKGIETESVLHDLSVEDARLLISALREVYKLGLDDGIGIMKELVERAGYMEKVREQCSAQ